MRDMSQGEYVLPFPDRRAAGTLLAERLTHAVALDTLPSLHKDPFDRILLAQAKVEGITLVTADAMVAKYPGAVKRV